MSQLQEVCATTQLGAPMAVTWLNGLGSRFSLIPTSAAFDCSWLISESIQLTPVAYGKLNTSWWPLLIPGPQRLGSWQVVTPLGTTFQPWLASSALALSGLYGNGSPCLPWGDRYCVAGYVPTGPTV